MHRKDETNNLEKRIDALEKRLERLEKLLGIRKTSSSSQSELQVVPEKQTAEFEGRGSMAILGLYIVAVSLILSLVQVWGTRTDIFLSAVILVLMGALLSLKRFIFRDNRIFELHFKSMSYLTIFLAYLKLYFFIPQPAIANTWIFFAGMVGIILCFLWLERTTMDWYSRFILMILMGTAGVLTGNHLILMLFIISMIYLGYVWCRTEKNEILLPLALAMGYIFEAIHYFDGLHMALLPFRMSRTWEFIPFFVYFVGSSIFALRRWKEENVYLQAVNIINVILGFSIFAVHSIKVFHPKLYQVHFFYFIIALLLASLYYKQIQSKYSTFFYAMSAYLALTISILTFFPFPESLLWLCLQSLLVIVTALWYRSKQIILANFFIFLGLFGLSILNSGSNGWIHGTFGITALLSARIINWKKSRLELKTELMRNLYLVSAFIILPIALNFLVPSAYYAYSLALLAFGYFFLRIILNIKKYFYLSAGTILWGIGYLFLRGFGHIPTVHIILSFLALGVLFIVVTIYNPKKE